ncbi:Anaphase-promoting complex subunit 13, partial [Stegodyphus mimosarum]
MDSNVARNGRLIDIVDSSWREEKLPDEHIAVPAAELPDPEPDNGNPQETLREQEQKWTDLALNKIHRITPSTVAS